MPRRLRRADKDIFNAIARSDSRLLQETLPRLSRAANHSRMWLAIAAGLVAFGGRQGRRAAIRGALSIAAASAIANLPAKFAVRRRRPDSGLVPEIRRLLKVPASYSFPSGHSASAAAFATGASLEMPALAVPLGVLAAGVGVSRVYTGVHHPSDVVVGMGIGAGVAVASRHFWPVVRLQPEAKELHVVDRLRTDEHGRGLALVVNPRSGTGFGDPVGRLREMLPAASIVEASPQNLRDRLEQAAAMGEVVGVAGGDGTVNAAASIARERKKPLLVVPSGTLNHFARDLNIESADDAIEVWKAGNTAAVEVATLDDQPFLNAASFGPYADFVDERNRIARRTGKFLATPIALARVLRRAEPLSVELDGRTRKLWMIFIGNNRYEPPGFAPATRKRLDDGSLDVRMITAERSWSRLRAALAALTGTLARSKVYEERATDGLDIRSLDGPLHLARDGETFKGGSHVVVRKLPDRLTVLVPAADRG